MSLKNYYEILNLSENCSDVEIRTAFRQQAKLYHPDINHADDASEKFRDVVEAFDVLSQKERRQAFDEMLKNQRLGIPVIEEEFQQEEWAERSEERSKKYSEFPLEELLMLELFADTGVIDGLLNGMGEIIDSAGDALDGLSDLF